MKIGVLGVFDVFLGHFYDDKGRKDNLDDSNHCESGGVDKMVLEKACVKKACVEATKAKPRSWCSAPFQSIHL